MQVVNYLEFIPDDLPKESLLVIDPTTIYYLTWIGWGLTAVVVLSLWLSLIIWTYRDITSRNRHLLVRLFAVLWVTLLFLPGLLIYLILRPAQTIEEEYHRALEEEALLRGLARAAYCPDCKRRVEQDWLVCPACETELKKTCSQCGKPIELCWKVCPYCTTPVEALHLLASNSEDGPAAQTPET